MNADVPDWVDSDEWAKYQATVRPALTVPEWVSSAEPVEPERVKGVPTRRVPPRRSPDFDWHAAKVAREADAAYLRDLLARGPQRVRDGRALMAARNPSYQTSNSRWTDFLRRAGITSQPFADGFYYLTLPD